MRHAPVIIGTSLVLISTALVIYFVISQLNKDDLAPKKTVQQISIVAPPPPPPPEVEPPPPEPEIEEKVDLPEPEPEMPEMSDEPPPGDLGVDADGSAGSDGFGLVGRKGGRGLLEGGRFGWYSHMLQTSIHEELSNIDLIREKTYSIVMAIWISEDGKVTRVRLQSSTGEANIDSAIEKALSKDIVLSQAPPFDLPQPVLLRITSRL